MILVSVRNIDKNGRVVIPQQLRDRYDLKEGSTLGFWIDDNDGLCLKKIENKCILCSSSSMLKQFNGKYVCERCLNKIKTY